MNQLSTFIKKTFLLMIVLSLLGCGASHSKKLSPHTLSLETETADPFIFKIIKHLIIYFQLMRIR
jgi:hypothetical protein